MRMGLIFGIVFGRGGVLVDRGGLGKRRRGAEVFELVEGAVEGPLDAGFVAREGFDGAGAGGVVGEGAGAGVETFDIVAELGDAVLEQACFERAQAAEAPGGHGHLLDEQDFSGACGLVFGEKRVEQFLKFVGILAGEDGGLGSEAVAQGVE